MKLIAIVHFILLAFTFQAATSIYDITLNTIEGNQQSMADFKGKKILIVVLPVTNTPQDSSALKTLDSLSKAYGANYSFVGIPAYEYGYSDDAQSSLRNYYRGIVGQQVIITSGVYVKKASGRKQNNLLSWLTDVKQNTHFDQEVKGVFQKYFVNEQGELFAVFGPEMYLQERLLNEMDQLQQGK